MLSCYFCVKIWLNLEVFDIQKRKKNYTYADVGSSMELVACHACNGILIAQIPERTHETQF
jgi:hypothetical protein